MPDSPDWPAMVRALIEANRAMADALERSLGDDKDKVRPATVNEKMLAMLERDPLKMEWSARQWADAMECSVSTIAKTAAWERILAARSLERSRRTEDDCSANG